MPQPTEAVECRVLSPADLNQLTSRPQEDQRLRNELRGHVYTQAGQVLERRRLPFPQTQEVDYSDPSRGGAPSRGVLIFDATPEIKARNEDGQEWALRLRQATNPSGRIGYINVERAIERWPRLRAEDYTQVNIEARPLNPDERYWGPKVVTLFYSNPK